MRSMMNPNRFLRSVQRQHWGNPQPTRTYCNKLRASIFTSTRRKGRKVRPFKLFVPRSDPFWRQQ
jgi:hypothetical protein